MLAARSLGLGVEIKPILVPYRCEEDAKCFVGDQFELQNQITLIVAGRVIYRMSVLMMAVILFGAKSSSTGNQLLQQ